jgi:predicted RNA-binding protein with PUA-like domain
MPKMSAPRSYWLIKSEPECFSIQHLAACPGQTTCWDGVRNYQARNFMRDMKLGDRVLFYHSSAAPPAVAGTAVVVREAYPDHTAFDPRSMHFDPKASRENPIWQMVDVRLEEIFPEPVPIGVLRSAAALKSMELLRRGSRLSVQRVAPREFQVVLELARAARKDGQSSKAARRDTGLSRAEKRAAPGKRAAAKKRPLAGKRRRSPSRHR